MPLSTFISLSLSLISLISVFLITQPKLAGVHGARGAPALVQVIQVPMSARSPGSAPAPNPCPSVGDPVLEAALQQPDVGPLWKLEMASTSTTSVLTVVHVSKGY